MTKVSTNEVPKRQTQGTSGRVSLYLRRNTNIRMAIDRDANADLAILKMLKQACKLSPGLSGRHSDVQ